jgi:two-component system, NtrC family, sensor kinase
MTAETSDLKTHAVLYVDDELQAGKYFRKGLEKDFRILTAGNVVEAMAVLEKEGASIGVVLTDQRMPGKSGVELLTQVRERWPAIVRILITAYSDLDNAVAAVNAGAVYKYITKPADFALLREVLTQGLALHRQTVERDQLAATLRELEEQRRATQAAEAQREVLQGRLISASREAGRAEVATGVLHNVGNVLNSMNTAASVIDKTLQDSRTGYLCKALEMFEEHKNNLTGFLTSDERGQRLPGYLNKLAGVLAEEHKTLTSEMSALRRSLEHIAQIVQMQQSYAKTSTVRAPLRPADLMEDALQVNLAAIGQQEVRIVRQYADIPSAQLDKHKVLQILINLISNAGNVLKDRAAGDKQLTLKIEGIGTDAAQQQIRFQVIDNGTGIAPENLTRIFSHGFTTRKDGHGFGLHSSANAAREMGGSLTAASGGPDCGATFTLELPLILDSVARLGGASEEKAAA